MAAEWLRTKSVQRAAIGLGLLLAVGVAVAAFESLEPGNRAEILAPATVPPVGELCTQPLDYSQLPNEVSPLFCQNGDINRTAWEQIRHDGPVVVMTLGRNPKPYEVSDAAARDLRSHMTPAWECDALELSAAYYGWTFHIDPVSGLLLSCPVMK